MRTILVTGGAGFIGSNFIKQIMFKYPDDYIINADALTYAGNLENLKDVARHTNYVFIKADIRDRQSMEQIFRSYKISTIVNFAAESHVDRSIEEPEVFLTTNIVGTQVLLDLSKKYWRLDTDDKYCTVYEPGVKFIQISTDEVYGTLGKTGLFRETMPLKPNSPYAASKAAADLMVRAYHQTYGLPINITRCSNNYGPNQFPEKLIPLMISRSLKDDSLPVYGNGLQIRDWLHVSDHCAAIDLVISKGQVGEVYNIGGNNEMPNLDLVKLILKILGKSENLIHFVKDRLGHDIRYAIDHSKITEQLGWQPQYTFEKGIKETIQWYLDNKEWAEKIQSYHHS